MKPTSPSDSNALGVTWLAVLQHRAEMLWKGPWGCSCKVESHPTTYFPHAKCFKNKNHSLSPPHLCQTQVLRSAVISRALLSSCKPGWPTPSTHEAPMALPFPLSRQQTCSYTQRCPHTAAVWLYREPSAFLAGGSWTKLAPQGKFCLCDF